MIKKTEQSYKKHIISLTIGPFIKLVEAIFDLLMPLFMKAIIDLNQYENPSSIPNKLSSSLASFIRLFGIWVPNNQSLNDALIGGIIILLMGVIGFILTMIAQYIAARTATNVGYEIREALYYKILHLSKKDKEKFTNSRLLTTLSSDTYQVQQGVLFFIRLVVRAPFIILGSLIFSFILDWKIGLIFLAVIPIITIVMLLVLNKSSKQYGSIQETIDDISTKTTDSINGVRVIKAFNQENNELSNFNKVTQTYENKSVKVHRLNSIVNPLLFALTSILTIVLLFLVRDGLLNGSEGEKVIISSTIIAEMAYLAQIFFATTQLPPVLLDIVKAGVSRKRINEILMFDSSLKDGNQTDFDNNSNVLEFRDVSFSFDEKNNHYALKNLNFILEKGKTLGIIGGIGSGKSTLINLIERFYDPTKGDIIYKGHNLKDYELSSLRKDIALVNQKASLFKGTIKSNFLMAKIKATDEEINTALKFSEAYDFVYQYEDNINHEVNEGGLNFSGGQRQRLTIARALLKGSELLILDDSTSALDLLTDKHIRDNIKAINGLTKIIVSQRIATIKDADTIILLDKGEIVAMGTHDNLLKTSDIYKEIYESQSQRG